MFPGTTTRLSEAPSVPAATVLSPQKDLIVIDDTATTTVIATITPTFMGFSGVLFIINRSGGNITTVTTGNILTAVTIGQNVAVAFIYSRSLGKWVPGALA